MLLCARFVGSSGCELKWNPSATSWKIQQKVSEIVKEAEDNDPFRLFGELHAIVDFVDKLCVGEVPVQ